MKSVRESELKLDSMQPTVRAERTYEQAKQDSPHARGKTLIRAARKIVDSHHEKILLDFLAGKTDQGKFSEIIELQSQDPFYRNIMYDLPRKQLSWLMHACIDCLPSFANLRRWGKVLSDKCAFCNERETTHHVLPWCQVAVKQKRLDLRHDSVLRHIVKQLHASKCKKRIIADVPGHKLPDEGTIPPELVVTVQRPDLVLIDKDTGDVDLYELTCPGDRQPNIDGARIRKRDRYAALVSDIAATGVKASITPFEVCALGNIRTDSRKTLSKLVGSQYKHA